ncbi:MAG: hypothetical protein NTY09_07505 [bacterium]|nr:hypothetical protein [bacterium]
MTSYSRYWLSGLLSLIMLFALSCSGSGGNPITPPSGTDPGPDITSGADNSADPGLTPSEDDSHASQGATSPNTVIGLYDVTFDYQTTQFDVVPIRGAEIALNVLKLLQPPGGDIANLQIKVIAFNQLLSDGLVSAEFTIKHPINDPKLACFDTMGIIIGDGGNTYDEDPAVKYGGVNDIQLLNFDGYTRWMNPVEFTAPTFFGYSEGIFGTKDVNWTASVNPYKYFSTYIGTNEDIQPYFDSIGSTTTRGVWQQNSPASRQYEIKFPMNGGSPVIKFQYLILTHWDLAVNDQGDPIGFPMPKQFPPTANVAEAVFIDADSTGSNLFYDEVSGSGGGNLVLTLKIYDWQGLQSFGGTGAFDQVDSIGLGSPDGLFGGTGYLLNSTALAGSEVSIGEYSTTLSVVISDLEPQKSGTKEIFLAVYNKDPNGYGPFGIFPADARLAAYTKFSVDVSQGDPSNEPPVIEEIQGPESVTCFDADIVYTCIATDPNTYSVIQYKWELIRPPGVPGFLGPYSDDNTAVIDWSDGSANPPGSYELWFQVTDGQFTDELELSIQKQASSFLVDPITSDDEYKNNVLCTVTDALYEVSIRTCGQPIQPIFQWLRGAGDPPETIDPMDPNWTIPSQDTFINYSWNQTSVGQWWIVAKAIGISFIPQFSEFYIVERVDTPSEPLEPPSGATDVYCYSIAEVYMLVGGADCDGDSMPARSWVISTTDVPPTDGWQLTLMSTFTVDWSTYPLGVYYVWQKIGTDESEIISDSLAVTRHNSPPDTPSTPFGNTFVDCSMTNEEYNGGDIVDCENDPVTRQWALSDTNVAPSTGWADFTGKTFNINWSNYISGDHYLFQRASDNGVDYVNSPSLKITKINTPPRKPDTPIGPESVMCTDSVQEYDGGQASECDIEDVFIRYWGVSTGMMIPPSTWFEFSGDLFDVDWSDYPNGMLFLYQRSVSGLDDQLSLPLSVEKLNAPPTLGIPSGPTSVDCSMTDAQYSITEIIDCDSTEFSTMWYLSTSPDFPVGGHWSVYTGSTFAVDYGIVANGDWYLFISVDDGTGQLITTSLHILKNNTAPNKPDVPSGPTEVTCTTTPAFYTSGVIFDCDFGSILTTYYYLSTDSVTPTGGTWILFLGGTMSVDFTGSVAEQPLYLFQKVSDGDLQTVSNPLTVVYLNTAPVFFDSQPVGDVTVSCSNDNEAYQGGPLNDCDTWQTLSRSYAITIVDWPPATGWVDFSFDTWTIDWSEYTEGTYYMFQRAYDGFDYTYSVSLAVTVGPPALGKPSTPVGNEDVVCDGATETYQAGDYMAGCSGVDITREWAVGSTPTPPMSGWTEFFGTSFLADPVDFGFGYVYLFQRATLNADTANSDALIVYVHPSTLGSPSMPSGSTSVDCSSIAELYEMGTVPTGCPDTPMTRFWQVQDASGTPVSDWVFFTSSPVEIDWTTYNPGVNYHLVQKANDGDHTQTSVPLVVTVVNTPPEFLGTITGATSVTCTNTAENYSCGGVSDCDHTQTLTHQWGWNGSPTPPVTGWQDITGTSFIVDYSSPSIPPGDVYLFQRVSDGVTTVYDPAYLHVVYTNTPPNSPAPPIGNTAITCANVLSTYDAGIASDCDGTTLTREWGVSSTSTPPVDDWTLFTGNSFDVLWSAYGYGTWHLFQRVSDGSATQTSFDISINYTNTTPSISSFAATEGFGPFVSDGGASSGYSGLTFVQALHYNFTVSDCDGETPENRYAVTTSVSAPPHGDPAWSAPIAGTSFTVNLSDYEAQAPGLLFVYLSAYDGTNFATAIPHPPITMWDRVWFTDFSAPGDMWAEDACVTGIGSYTWSYDGANGYLRMTNYGASSSSSMWGSTVLFPAAPSAGFVGTLQAYVNPGLSATSGLDNVTFSFLNSSCTLVSTATIITGQGCGANKPALKQNTIAIGSPIWGGPWKVGLRHNGFDGCGSANLFVDWVGFWVKPS